MNYLSFTKSDYFQLLKRPRELPDFVGADAGINAVWRCKMVYWSVKKNLIPRIVYKATAKIQFSNFLIEGKFPPFEQIIPLVSICFVEANEKKNCLSVRGRWFKVEMFGISNILDVQEWLRFLIVRQRIPYSILGKKFDWEVNQKDDKENDIDNKNKIKESPKEYDIISVYDNISVNDLQIVPISLKKSLLACFPF
uniref:Uncharacterized protein n=1 Tax=Parastrongyloides trichosuri TaxID=131310 RepID=A0A0N5A3T3_PARTI